MSANESQVERDTNLEPDSASKDLADRKRTQALLSAQRRSLQMIACGASLKDALQDLSDTIDAQAPEIISSILLIDSNAEHLLHGIGRERTRVT